MTRREWAVAALCALLGAALGLALAVPVAGIQASRPEPVAAGLLTPVLLATPSGAPDGTLRPSTNAPAAVTATPVMPTPAAASSPTPRPGSKTLRAQPKPAPSPSGRTGTAYVGLRGVATWYAAPDGTAAAGPSLRALLGRGWRGTVVTVTAGGRSVRVRLTDWMRADRLIDLNSRAFAALAPLSRGVLAVTVEAAR